MRVFIIGGTGFVGPPVARGLVELGHEVTVFHRGRTTADLPLEVRDLRCPEHDLGRRDHYSDLKGDFSRLSPDIVLDMIPVTERDALCVLDAFRGLAGRLVALSSQDVYRAYGLVSGTETGSPDALPLPETAPLRTRLHPYRGPNPRADDDPQRWMDDYDKIQVERIYLKDPDLRGTILRLPMVYGPRDRQHRLHEYLRPMDDGRPAIVIEESLARWSWTRGYVENVADAVIRAVIDERAAGRVFNVGEREALTTADWVRAIAAAAGWTGRVVTVPGDELPDAMRSPMCTDQDLVTDTTRIRTELGYDERVSFEEGLARTVAWERDHPPEPLPSLDAEYAAEDAILARR